jgi:hypothetical protein
VKIMNIKLTDRPDIEKFLWEKQRRQALKALDGLNWENAADLTIRQTSNKRYSIRPQEAIYSINTKSMKWINWFKLKNWPQIWWEVTKSIGPNLKLASNRIVSNCEVRIGRQYVSIFPYRSEYSKVRANCMVSLKGIQVISFLNKFRDHYKPMHPKSTKVKEMKN